MTAIIELVGSREKTVGVENPSVTLRYTVAGATDDAVVDALVQATVPAFYNGLPFQSYHATDQGNGVWSVEVAYGRRAPRSLGSIKFAFDTTGEKIKQKYSLATASGPYVPAGAAVIDFKGGINVKKSGEKTEVEGVEITIPKFAFTLETITTNPPLGSFVNNLFLKTGTVNSDDLTITVNTGLPPPLTIDVKTGELLFVGATGQEQAVENGIPTFQITQRWEFSPNQVGLTIGGITDIVKRGWDYLWVSYEPEVSNNKFVQKPRQVNVDQVYRMTSHADLFPS